MRSWKDDALLLDFFLQGLPLDLDHLDVRGRDFQGQLAGEEEVPPEARGDIDDVALAAHVFHVLFQNDLHGASVPLRLSIRDVGQQGQQARPLHGRGQLPLVEGARPGDPAGRNLAPVRDVFFQDIHVLVVDELDVPLAEPAELFLRGEKLLVGAFRLLVAVRSSLGHLTSPRVCWARAGASAAAVGAGPRPPSFPVAAAGLLFLARVLPRLLDQGQVAEDRVHLAEAPAQLRAGCPARPRSGRKHR